MHVHIVYFLHFYWNWVYFSWNIWQCLLVEMVLLTNVLPHWNTIEQMKDQHPMPVTVHRHRTWHPMPIIVHRHRANLSCYPSVCIIPLEATNTHLYVLGLTDLSHSCFICMCIWFNVYMCMYVGMYTFIQSVTVGSNLLFMLTVSFRWGEKSPEISIVLHLAPNINTE